MDRVQIKGAYYSVIPALSVEEEALILSYITDIQ